MREFTVVLAATTCIWHAVVLSCAKAEWKSVRTLPAPEAHQAAAADDAYVYAISSRVIAKYDRKTGQRIAISTGDAKHLNSGFVYRGQLLSAHSNYPSVPEKSEIKVLDPKSMKLTTFKNFGDFGGSLVWVIHYKRHWWCNFAKYGKENGNTFLVKFDAKWNEVQRWTYPAELIQQIGSYSLSGGLWKGDALLVTDHDHQRVYRLSLPDSGRVLKLDGQESAPFTGQGFAIDPKGGLIGINRAKKLIVFATAE